jgi:hypothetical protein
VLTEAEQKEQAAWKQVEETGKPVLVNGQFFMPERSFEYSCLVESG